MALGALPYHFKITGRTGTGGAGDNYVLTFEILDANNVVKATDTIQYGALTTAHEIKEAIANKVRTTTATDSGGTAALITAMVGVANDMDGAPTASLQGTGASSSTFWRGDGTWAVPSGGSDPWTYAKLAADFLTTSATAVDVTGLAFTPAANTNYEFEGLLMIRTATTSVNPRPGLAWPTGGTDGIAAIWEAQVAAGNMLTATGNINAALLIAIGALPNTTQSWPVKIQGMFMAGATPSGTMRVQLASETAGTNVTMKAGSFIRWRTF